MRRNAILSAQIEFDVAFHDVDMVGVVWHGHYLRYLENARWALMDRLHYGLQEMIASGYMWPIVELKAKYIHAASFGDRLVARAGLVEYERRLEINYLISKASDGERVARALSVQVAVHAASGVLQFDCPAEFVRRVRAMVARADA